ncbi:hypothetical protein B7P43_G11787 [Cryptotermes secundus]|uniref:Uncharacterized protein n=1 Tax=Cryptotermes secundus TaxID=105785 RepID=A0A2J7PC10_9NEOP|nr:hypothetical protein B7P43_G11787 [Cryptotermes secundus]
MGDIRDNFTRLQGQTDGLVDWIRKVRVKKRSLTRHRRENLRVEAILTSALMEAETLLRMEQQQRFQRWQRLKTEVCKSDCSNVCSVTSNDNVSNQWHEKTCEEINSLDRFMCLLNEVKTPLQR